MYVVTHGWLPPRRKVLKAGSSKPWPEVLQEALGTNKMDATALMKYFDPIITWLGEQNVNETIGWPEFNWVPPIPEGYPASIGKYVIHGSVEPKVTW